MSHDDHDDYENLYTRAALDPENDEDDEEEPSQGRRRGRNKTRTRAPGFFIIPGLGCANSAAPSIRRPVPSRGASWSERAVNIGAQGCTCRYGRRPIMACRVVPERPRCGSWRRRGL
jgi:hypothetical protein